MKVVVYHSFYGCDSGCCGHIVEFEDESRSFRFSHPGEDHRAYAEGLVREVLGDQHVADLDWENCFILDD